MSYLDRAANNNRFSIDQLNYPQKKKLMRWTIYVWTAIAILVFMAPMYWMLNASLLPIERILTDPAYVPVEFTLKSYESVILERNYLRWYFNSVVVALGTIVLTIITATLAGYGLTRVDFRGQKYFANGVLFSYMFPPILLAFPQYQLWSSLGWLNTYHGIIIAHVARALPFSMWVMWKFFQTVPIELEESIWMNGGTRYHSLKDVALPMAKPGMIAIAIFAFAVSWNDFTMSSILLPQSEMQTLPPAVNSFTEQNYVQWTQIMAASVLMSIPPFALVYKLQKSILEGFKLS